MIRVYRARNADHFHAIAGLQAAVLPLDAPHSMDAGAWWLALDDGLPVAFAGLVPSTRWGDCSYLCRAGVLESHRGRGIQKRLIGVREKYAREVGHRWLITDTTGNPASSNSLISCGFRLFHPSRPWGPDRALYWRKRLD